MSDVSLKEMSDAAPPGPWALSPQELDDWGMIRAAFDPETSFRPVVCSIRSHDDEAEQAAARQEGRQPKSVQARADFIIALERAYRAGRLHDDTALATAVARARREALEEAARRAKSHKDEFKLLSPECSAAISALSVLQHELQSLAATPPEARRTETAWKPMETAHKDGRTILACRDNGCGWGFHLVRWQSGKHGYPWQSATDDNAFPEGRLGYWQPVDPPPPAIGNLEGEGRS
jgi:hypothetical protein